MKRIIRFIVFTLLGLVNMQGVSAQNVTISPQTGKLVAALTYEQETGFAAGLSAMWRHEQLALTMTTSDFDELTESGEIADPSCAIGEYDADGDGVSNLIIAGGHMPTFMIVSLPNGYRITGYKLVLVNNLAGKDIRKDKTIESDFSSINSGAMHFYETNAWTTGSTSNTATLDDYLEVATASDGDTEINCGNTADEGKEYTIERTSTTSDDMGNQLYFRLTKSTNYYFYGVSIKSFEIYFTAEGTFTANVKPATTSNVAVSMVPAPFSTNKIDVGELKSYTKDGATYYSYNYTNVKDLLAYNYVYQEEAVENGVPADVATTKKIYQTSNGGNNYFGLKNGVYYVETPIEIANSSGNKAPIGYRIVGARVNYAYGTDSSGGTTTETLNYITYTSGETTYYLNTSGKFGTSPISWEVTDEGYVHNGNVYLLYSKSGNTRSLSVGSYSTNAQLVRVSGNYLYYTSTNSHTTYYLQGTTSSSSAPTFSSSSSTTSRAIWKTEETTYTTPDFTAEEYQIQFYDRTGAAISEADGGLITVNSTNSSGTFDGMGLMNNDAVKFEILGIEGTNGMALVTVDLDLQALDPYIDKMDIVCHDQAGLLSLTQSFTADDFSVSGGKFIFYVPEDYKDELLTFTFSDLYSKYGDETYYDGSGTGASRYSYVTSDYFFPVNGNENDGLYDDAYDPDAEYTTKVYTSTAGNIRFKFNNAEDLSNENTSTESAYLEEYPFSVSAYLGSEDPDGTSETGEFISCQLRASDEVHSDVYYVFTADETRWNIAPSKAWQHRYYAFYRMEIDLQARTFIPDFTWYKVYDSTCYSEKGSVVDKSMWGLKLGTKGEDGTAVTGYLTYQEIINAIDTQIKDESIDTPESTDQIFYVDGSDLLSMLNSSQNTVVKTLSDLKGLLATNALVYLPENTTSTLDNVAYMTSSGTFRAGKNIVITDQRPFYAPYDIQVDAANYATYTRTKTNSNKKVTKASLMLPFTIDLTDGEHENSDGTAFKLYQMVPSEALSYTASDTEGTDYTASFTEITSSTSTANEPYVVEVTAAPDDDDVSFTVICKGSLIEETTAGTQGVFTSSSSSSGSVNGNSYSFYPTGTYGGQEIEKEGNYIFYFANDKFYNNQNLSTTLKMSPFRAYYCYDSTASAKLMNMFDISFFKKDNSEATGINEIAAETDLKVASGYGTITLKAGKDVAVAVASLSGMSVAKASMKAGDVRTIKVPSGLYVVNGVKIMVK